MAGRKAIGYRSEIRDPKRQSFNSAEFDASVLPCQHPLSRVFVRDLPRFISDNGKVTHSIPVSWTDESVVASLSDSTIWIMELLRRHIALIIQSADRLNHLKCMQSPDFKHSAKFRFILFLYFDLYALKRAGMPSSRFLPQTPTFPRNSPFGRLPFKSSVMSSFVFQLNILIWLSHKRIN